MHVTGFKVGGNIRARGNVTNRVNPASQGGNGESPVTVVGYDVGQEIIAENVINEVGNERSTEPATATRSGSRETDKIQSPEQKPGQVLIINNLFNRIGRDIPSSVSPERYIELGKSITDDKIRKDLESLFKNCIGLETVEVEENVKSFELKKILDDFKNGLIKNESRFSLVVLVSHGGSKANSILMDDLIELDLFQHLLAQFNHNNFQEFIGKPKLFILQAFEKDVDVTFDMDAQMDIDNKYYDKNIQDQPVAPNALAILPQVGRQQLVPGKLEDIFVSRPCLPIRLALREIGCERYFTRSIIETLAIFHRTDNLIQMHEKVRDEIAEWIRSDKVRQDKYGVHCNTPCYHASNNFNKEFFF